MAAVGFENHARPVPGKKSEAERSLSPKIAAGRCPGAGCHLSVHRRNSETSPLEVCHKQRTVCPREQASKKQSCDDAGQIHTMPKSDCVVWAWEFFFSLKKWAWEFHFHISGGAEIKAGMWRGTEDTYSLNLWSKYVESWMLSTEPCNAILATCIFPPFSGAGYLPSPIICVVR